MYGLEAINAYNGWAMSAVGACIVLVGLSVLAFLISQLHKLTGIMEKSGKKQTATPNDSETETKPIVPDRLPEDIEAAVTLYKSFVTNLGSSFKLPDLYKVSADIGLPHPHLSIRGFREQGFLIPDGEDLFRWK